MTKEELEALLAQCANPDTAPIALSTLKDKACAMIAEAEAAKAKAADDAAKIAELRDTNMRMFLRQTSEAGEEEHEETTEEMNERLRKALMGD